MKTPATQAGPPRWPGLVRSAARITSLRHLGSSAQKPPRQKSDTICTR
jgi:hypothetical protein